MRISKMFAVVLLAISASAFAGGGNGKDTPPQGGGNGAPKERSTGTSGGGVGREAARSAQGGAIGRTNSNK